MAVELYINDQLVDVRDTPELAADYAIYNVEDISKRTGARSYSIELPLTNRNKSVLESCEQIPSLSRVPYQTLKARCYSNGVDLGIRFGYIERVKDEYNVRLFGENPDFFIKASETKLSELKFPCTFDHFWTLDNIVANRNNLIGYVYAFIDYCSNSPNTFINNASTDIEAQYVFPSMLLHSVFDAMASNFNITVNNEVELTANYPLDKVIIPFARQEFIRNRQPDRYEALFTNTNDIVLNTAVPPIGTQPSYGVWLNMDTVTESCGVYWNYGNFTDYFRFGEKIRFTVDYDFTLSGAYFGINSDNIMVFTTQLVATTNIPLQSPSNYQEINAVHIEYGIDTHVSGSFTFQTEISALGNGILDNTFTVFIAGFPTEYILRAGSFMRIRQVEILEDGEVIYNNAEQQKNYVTASTILPDWTCAQFIKQYCLLFNALPIFNGNTLSIVPFNKVVQQLDKAIDWSDKVDYTERYELAFSNNIYAQRNILKYIDEEGVIKPDGTDGTLLVDNRNLDGEKVLIELAYGATQSEKRWFNNDIPNIKIVDAGDSENYSKVEPRILVLDILQPSDLGAGIGNVTVTDRTVSTSIAIVSDIPVPYFIKSVKEFNLGFGDNLITNYFGIIQGIMLSPKIVTPLIRLNATDINQLDFMRPIFIQQYEAYFYISIVKAFSFTESSSTQVELVKLNL